MRHQISRTRVLFHLLTRENFQRSISDLPIHFTGASKRFSYQEQELRNWGSWLVRNTSTDHEHEFFTSLSEKAGETSLHYQRRPHAYRKFSGTA